MWVLILQIIIPSLVFLYGICEHLLYCQNIFVPFLLGRNLFLPQTKFEIYVLMSVNVNVIHGWAPVSSNKFSYILWPYQYNI